MGRYFDDFLQNGRIQGYRYQSKRPKTSMKQIIIGTLFLVVLAVASAPSNKVSRSADFKQQMSQIVRNIKTLDSPQGRQLKTLLLKQILRLYDILKRFEATTATLVDVQHAVKNILTTIKYIKAVNYEQQARVGGKYNTAYGSDSSAEGFHSTVTGDNSVVEGYKNKLTGDNAFAAGSRSNIVGDNTFALGRSMNVRGDNTIVFGARKKVQGDNLLVIGKYHIDMEALNEGDDSFLSTHY